MAINYCISEKNKLPYLQIYEQWVMEMCGAFICNWFKEEFCLELIPYISLIKQNYVSYIIISAISVKHTFGDWVRKLSGCILQK